MHHHYCFARRKGMFSGAWFRGRDQAAACIWTRFPGETGNHFTTTPFIFGARPTVSVKSRNVC
ncbi:hypothetical protein BJV82DRAFT_636552 [Fennellomyces sp. T-0311]|nr:hypothetical protein BJV82DRAFT_636552 [Fennellomyces sp. T-0311]